MSARKWYNIARVTFLYDPIPTKIESVLNNGELIYY